MAIEIKDNETIELLEKIRFDLLSMDAKLAVEFNISVNSHIRKVTNVIENAIKKERVKILESEIEKIKKGEV